MSTTSLLYEKDFYAWTQEQIKLIENKLFNKIDYQHLSEELQIMGRSEKRELSHRLTVLLMHLLKWKHQPLRQCKSWIVTIYEQRQELEDVLSDNPSLKHNFDEHFSKAYSRAVSKASVETGLDAKFFAPQCEWTIEQILDPDFLP